MKSLIFTFALFFIFAQHLLADNGYEQAMKKGMDDLQNAGSPEAMNQVANYFERIASVETVQWLPNYYAAYIRINLGFMEQSDEQLDQVQTHLDQMMNKQKDESEVMALQGYLHMIRISLDPANHGPQLAPKTLETLSKAVQMNPENPRALMLLAQMQYGTAQFFKSDTGEACQMVAKSLTLFEQEKVASTFSPAWGKEIAQSIQQECKEGE
ncbi:hypothetical protein [Catalinimonas niigatensis]|uniref:hypothetical protein n=1 Tax=Catalinimonas niigatensis TaxID=1397264 RepID=UPI0026658E6E|nr:hypothetical protein [Catalinimonas niigatensis]WPP48645.1 hypothetical protein PZB72_18405 [Catalinimonas niigatensis]